MIVASKIILNDRQSDGRLTIMEIHTDDHGNEIQISYMADAGIDVSAKLAQHAADLNAGS